MGLIVLLDQVSFEYYVYEKKNPFAMNSTMMNYVIGTEMDMHRMRFLQ